jgi:hypothetical protein
MYEEGNSISAIVYVKLQHILPRIKIPSASTTIYFSPFDTNHGQRKFKNIPRNAARQPPSLRNALGMERNRNDPNTSLNVFSP